MTCLFCNKPVHKPKEDGPGAVLCTSCLVDSEGPSAATGDNKVAVGSIPDCDLCGQYKARYDARHVDGYWANMCHNCWLRYAMYSTLGPGKGQELVKGES